MTQVSEAQEHQDGIQLAAVLPIATLLIIASFLAVTSADADLWGHLIFGRDIVSSGSVYQRDVYSFTSDLPWVNHEWLAEVIMWSTYAAGGSAGLVALKLVIVCVCGGLLLETWRPFGLTPMRRDGMLFLAALGAWPVLVTIRPQLFSMLLFACLLFVLVQARSGQARWLAIVPVLFGLWVNLHGGWLVGASTLTVFLAAFAFESADQYRKRVALVVMTLLAAGAATMCNPYGVRMLAFLWETVGPSRADIREWQPVTRLPLVVFVLWLIPTSVALAALWRGRRMVPLSSVAAVGLLCVGSFLVARLVGFYSLATAFLVAPWAVGFVPTPQRNPPKRLMACALAAAIIAVAVLGFGRQIGMGPSYLPEPEAAEYVVQHQLKGKMFTWFDYGQYAIWHFWPSVRVSMDGRRETVYSQQMRDKHFLIYSNGPGALDAVTSLAPDFAWLPANAPVVPALQAAGWQVGFKGPRSVVLYRNAQPPIPTTLVDSSFDGPRSFPGP